MSTDLWVVQAALMAQYESVVPEDAKVYRGPRTRSFVPQLFVLVGTDGGEFGLASSDDGMSAEQQASSTGPGTWRDETGEITCSAWAWSGGELETVRAQAQELFALCEGVIYTDPSLGGALPTTSRAQVTEVAIRESQTDKGPVVRVSWSVSYISLITS